MSLVILDNRPGYKSLSNDFTGWKTIDGGSSNIGFVGPRLLATEVVGL